MSYELELIRSDEKVAYSIILQHILQLKAKRGENEAMINASDLSTNFHIPYRTVQSVMVDLHNQGYISSLTRQ